MVMEFVENREVEKEQLKAIFRDMVKFNSCRIFLLKSMMRRFLKAMRIWLMM